MNDTVDFTINVNGIDIVIEPHSAEARNDRVHMQRKRLLAYYERLLEVTGAKETPERKAALNRIVDNMTEKNAEENADIFKQRQLKRLLAYAEKFSDLTRKQSIEESEQISKSDMEKAVKMADALTEVLDAAIEDPDDQETVEINGNKFVYERETLDIKNYAEKLYDIGEKTKGNTWTIYLDKDGELVIY